ncbi:MAG TPA: DUF1553 domain-containing protein [Bryobacterales bacterium]|nr:DUF1553 domain-containing protein [Bryobacterales bacterium]
MIKQIVAAALLLAAPCFAARPASIRILPGDIVLSGPASSQQLIVQARLAEGQEQDLTSQAAFRPADPKIVKAEGGVLLPLADGSTELTAEVEGVSATIKVTVREFGQPLVPSFLNDVQPVLTKAGCNSGACHGSEAGKNGFKLSLRGYDSEFDHAMLTREAAGRRVTPWDPSKSLLLLKPTLTIPHGGGRRFAADSPDFRILSEWIANGAPAPDSNDPRIESLSVFPEEAWLTPEADQQVVVQANYSDGSSRDVTRWAKFSSTNSGVATVDDLGRVKMQGPGEAAVTVWYSSKVKFARLGVAFEHEIDPSIYTSAPRNNYIDERVLEKLQALHIAPSEQADDSTFLRRAYLDAMGALPSPAEVERFAADPSPNKRERLIEAVLGREEFVDYWTYKWSDLLLVSSRDLNTSAMWSYYRWVRESVEKNTPWDQIVRQILTSSGNSRIHGELNYYQLHQNTIELAENVTQAFMGIRITCARCHNHPLEKWTQNDYYQFANLVSRVAQKNGTGAGDVVVYRSPSGGINHPKLGKPLPPRPLDGEELALDGAADRRQHLADWLTSADNPYFARAVVNKIWENFMGRGIVHPVDDMRASNPASNEKLLSALTADFIEHKFDVKHLIRRIMLSATYQRSSRSNETNADDDVYYSRYIVRRLPAEVVLDAISQVTRVPTRFSGYPEGTRALQLPDTQVNSYFLTVFGRPARINVDAAEREHAPTIKQALHVINGDTLNNMLRDQEGAIEMFLKLGLSNVKILDHLYLSALSRYPTDAERKALMAALDEAEKETAADALERDPRRKPLEDLMWAMLTGKEFLFNH